MANNNRSKYLLFCLISAFFCSMAQAQQYEVSTADNPRWFFIRVKGAGATAGRVVTENNGAVAGESLRSGSFSEISKQLWRIEQGTTVNGFPSYRLINKHSGKKLDITYDAGRAERIAVAGETPLTEWRITSSNGAYALRAVTEPAGGTRGYFFLTQTGSEKGYIFVFSTSASLSNANTQYEFLAYHSMPLISTGDDTAWLRIQNAKTSLAGQCLADVGDATANGPFRMVAQTANDHSQQWKIVSNSGTGQVDFVNRATGRTIGTQTVYNDRFYYLQAITGAPAGEGWQIRSINNGLYEIASGASTAAWYWNAAAGDESPRVYSGSPDKEQGFAWQFSLVEEFIPGLRQPEMPAGVRISVQDRVIRVEGVASYTIINIYGMHMPTHQPLPAGVYLVNIPDKTIKVLVK